MCWVGKPIKHVAEEDIPCFKICRKTTGMTFVVSAYMSALYFPGKTYSLKDKDEDLCHVGDVDASDGRYCVIHKGFHSYHPSVRIIKSEYTNCWNTLPSTKGIRIEYENGEFLDSFTCNTSRLCKVECVIPKGSVYYLNDRGEYVSDIIKILRIEQKCI